MGIPKIKESCVQAVVESAVRIPPDQFAAEFMAKNLVEQPKLLGGIMSICEGLTEALIGDDKENEEVMAVRIAMLTCCAVTFNIIQAQIESNELEEMFAKDSA
tara:strand:+ start:124 stop:432 length:309 start_codon:yes stop_codon:yes gene_type:complete